MPTKKGRAEQLNFRIDAELKEQFQEVCEGLGITTTAALVLFAKAVVRARGIPFRVSLDPDEPLDV